MLYLRFALRLTSWQCRPLEDALLCRFEHQQPLRTQLTFAFIDPRSQTRITNPTSGLVQFYSFGDVASHLKVVYYIPLSATFKVI
jgi:hypothetical protein